VAVVSVEVEVDDFDASAQPANANSAPRMDDEWNGWGGHRTLGYTGATQQQCSARKKA